VDEAYTLAPGGASETKDFGREVIGYMEVRGGRMLISIMNTHMH
jgi:hypothetical protein